MANPNRYGVMNKYMTDAGSGDINAQLIARLGASAATNTPALVYTAANSRRVYTPITDDRWAGWDLAQEATGVWAIQGVSAFVVLKATDSEDAGVTYSGTDWWRGLTQAVALGGTYSYTEIAEAYCQFTVTGGQHLWISVAKLSNSGILSVTINGATTLVNELPGATVDLYAADAAWHQFVHVSSALDPATSYTVRLTCTGTKHASSSGIRITFEGFGVELADFGDLTGVTNYAAVESPDVRVANSVWESAINFKPTGATNYVWTGIAHGNEAFSTVTWQDGDGTDISVSAGAPVSEAATIVINQVGTTRHSETGETDHANVTYRHTFTSAGLTIYHQHAWLTNAGIALAYPVMMSFLAGLDRGYIAGGAQYTLTADDGTQWGQIRARCAALWKQGTNRVFWSYMDNTAPVDNWANSVIYNAIEDRADGLVDKIYFQRVGGSEGTLKTSIVAGDVWESTGHYRVNYFANPDAALV